MPNTLQAVLLFWILSWVRAPGSYIFLSFRRKAPLPSPQPFPEKGLQAAVANTRHVHLVILSEDYENVNYHDKIIPPRFENKWSMFWIWLKEGEKKKIQKLFENWAGGKKILSLTLPRCFFSWFLSSLPVQMQLIFASSGSISLRTNKDESRFWETKNIPNCTGSRRNCGALEFCGLKESTCQCRRCQETWVWSLGQEDPLE